MISPGGGDLPLNMVATGTRRKPAHGRPSLRSGCVRLPAGRSAPSREPAVRGSASHRRGDCPDLTEQLAAMACCSFEPLTASRTACPRRGRPDFELTAPGLIVSGCLNMGATGFYHREQAATFTGPRRQRSCRDQVEATWSTRRLLLRPVTATRPASGPRPQQR